jgi:hypothetical protein
VRGWFQVQVDGPSGDRWELAVDLLERGETIAVAGVGLSLRGAEEFLVEVPSTWRGPDQVTEESARADLLRGVSIVDVARTDGRFSELLAGRRITAELIDDYDTGAVLIATLRDGDVIWAD